MPVVSFPQVLQRHVSCPPVAVAGRTLREALEAAFAIYPQVRGYVLDDSGGLRAHMTVFLDGQPVRDRQRLATSLQGIARIDVLQALSGG